MALKTREQIRDRAFQRANMEDYDDFLSEEEMNGLINVALKDYYEHILDAEVGEIFVTNAPILTKSGTYSFVLPADFFKLRNISYYRGDRYHRLGKANPSDYPQLTTREPSEAAAKYVLRYDMQTDVWCAHCFPSTLQAANLAVMYIPEPPLFTSDADQIGFLNGWEEYVVIQCAIWAREKEGTEYTGLLAELEEIKSDISSHSAYVDAGEPTLMQDTRNRHPTSWR